MHLTSKPASVTHIPCLLEGLSQHSAAIATANVKADTRRYGPYYWDGSCSQKLM